MTLEEALPLVRTLSAADKLRLIDELARELIAEHRRPPASPALRPATAPLAVGGIPPEPCDEETWSAWLDSLLDAATDRIAAVQQELRARGIVDEEGNLLLATLPADMMPGSTTSVSTG